MCLLLGVETCESELNYLRAIKALKCHSDLYLLLFISFDPVTSVI